LKGYTDQKASELFMRLESHDADFTEVKADIKALEELIEQLQITSGGSASSGEIDDAINSLRAELTASLKGYTDQKASELFMRLESHDADFAEVKADIKALEELIEQLQTTSGGSASKGDIEEAVGVLRAELTATLQNYTDRMVNALASKVEGNTAGIGDLETEIEKINASIALLTYASGDDMAEVVESLKEKITATVQGYVDQKMTSLIERVKGAEADINTIKADIAEIEAALRLMELNLSSYATDAEVASALDNVKAELTKTLQRYADQKIDALTEKVNGNSSDSAALKTRMDEIEAAIALLEKTLSSYATDEEVASSVAALRGELTTALQAYVDQKLESLTQQVQKSEEIIKELSERKESPAAVAGVALGGIGTGTSVLLGIWMVLKKVKG